MAGENYRLIVRHKDWKNDVLNVNLNQYLLLTQMEGHDIPAQEYLDRQDEYSIVFFLTPIICPDCPDPDPIPIPIRSLIRTRHPIRTRKSPIPRCPS